MNPAALSGIESHREVIDPAFENVLVAIGKHPELWGGIITAWGIIALAYVLVFIGSRDTPKTARAEVWYRTPDGWVIPALVFGAIVRLSLFSDFPYGFVDEPYYFQAILTGLGKEMADYLPTMTGSMFLWPPVSFVAGTLGQSLGLPLMLLPRIITVVLVSGSLYTMSRLVKFLAWRWYAENRLPRTTADWLPLVAVILPLFCANSLYDSTFASYNPMSVFFLTQGLYWGVRGAHDNKPPLLTASAAFILLAFASRFFPFILNIPFILIVIGYYAWRRNTIKSTLIWFTIPLLILVGGFTLYMGEKIFMPIGNASGMSASTEIDRLTIIKYMLSGAGIIIIPGFLGATMLLSSGRTGTRAQWPAHTETLAWLAMGYAVVGYYLVFGRVFSMAQDLALVAVFGIPLASLGATGLVHALAKNALWRKFVVAVAAIAVLSITGMHSIKETDILRHLMYSDTRNVIKWFRDSVHLPSEGQFDFFNAKMASNPWSMKILHNWFDQRLYVHAEIAFDRNLYQTLRNANPDFIHVSYRRTDAKPGKGQTQNQCDAQNTCSDDTPGSIRHHFSPEHWNLIQDTRYDVYRIQSADTIYINYVLVKRSKNIRITESPLAEKLAPPTAAR